MADLLTVSEVAEIMGVTTKTVYRWIWASDLPAIRLGPSNRWIRVSPDDLAEYFDTRQTA